ncbi:Fpg/Nei family DNA glycosylase [Angustibacter peucedani]
MPEGDVVWRTADRLHAALAGRELTLSDLRWPSLATVDLSGRTVLEVRPRGKHLLLRVDGATPVTLHSHLRMEGSWHVHRTGQRWGSARRADAVRAVVANAEWTAVGHKLGMLDLVPTADEGSLVGHLGPDVLGDDWDAARVLATMRETPERPIGEALLDQRVLCGVGTMYMAECLFVRGVNPWMPTAQVPHLDGLLERVQAMMQANLPRAVQTTTGDTRNGQNTWVHGRMRQPCRRCRTPIRVEPIGQAPHDRVAFFCPHCQPPVEA